MEIEDWEILDAVFFDPPPPSRDKKKMKIIVA